VVELQPLPTFAKLPSLPCSSRVVSPSSVQRHGRRRPILHCDEELLRATTLTRWNRQTPFISGFKASARLERGLNGTASAHDPP
jgi:hypothetical protein